jgi:hypothetical protein
LRSATVDPAAQPRKPNPQIPESDSLLADTDQARIEAAQRIGLLLHEHANKLWADEDWQMDVTDDTGLILFVINVHALKSPATDR